MNPYANPTITVLGPGYSGGIKWIAADSSGNLYLAVQDSSGSELVAVQNSDIGDKTAWMGVSGSYLSGAKFSSVAAENLMNIYTVDEVTGNVYKASSGSFDTTPLVSFSGVLPYYNGTVDGDGNLYLLGQNDYNTVVQLRQANGYKDPTVLTKTAQKAYSTYVDGSRNLLVAAWDVDAGMVVKGTYSAAGYSFSTLNIPGLHQPRDVVEDSSGNLFILDWDETGTENLDYVVYEAIPVGNSYTLEKVADSTLNSVAVHAMANSIAVDPSGDVFLAESSAPGNVIEIKP